MFFPLYDIAIYERNSRAKRISLKSNELSSLKNGEISPIGEIPYKTSSAIKRPKCSLPFSQFRWF